jgi:hypothetical protein
VEVKGSQVQLNWEGRLLADATDFGIGLPHVTEGFGTTKGLLLLGPIPFVESGQWPIHPLIQHHEGLYVNGWGFTWCRGGPPLVVGDKKWSGKRIMGCGGVGFFDPLPIDPSFWCVDHETVAPCQLPFAYRAARSARFEHGESFADVNVVFPDLQILDPFILPEAGQ